MIYSRLCIEFIPVYTCCLGSSLSEDKLIIFVNMSIANITNIIANPHNNFLKNSFLFSLLTDFLITSGTSVFIFINNLCVYISPFIFFIKLLIDDFGCRICPLTSNIHGIFKSLAYSINALQPLFLYLSSLQIKSLLLNGTS